MHCFGSEDHLADLCSFHNPFHYEPVVLVDSTSCVCRPQPLRGVSSRLWQYGTTQAAFRALRSPRCRSAVSVLGASLGVVETMYVGRIPSEKRKLAHEPSHSASGCAAHSEKQFSDTSQRPLRVCAIHVRRLRRHLSETTGAPVRNQSRFATGFFHQ